RPPAMLSLQTRHQVNTTIPCRTDGTSQEEDMKRLFALIAMVAVTTLATSAFAGEMKMIGTVSSIKIVGSSAEMTLKDRKTDSPITLQVRDKSNLEKIKDRKVRVGDELRLRFDSDSKVIRTIQKTAGC
ncbi:MAG: hypothetical protein J0653_05325, partial [Deltaproteobacteria bacterium]|nr:hypothetical protein [Deltaproteobacteria bacterium]